MLPTQNITISINTAPAKAEELPPDDLPGKRGHAPIKASIAKAEEPPLDDLPGKNGGVTITVGQATQSTSTAPPPAGGEDILPGLALEGEPIPGVDVNLGKNPGGIVASSQTDGTGTFYFDKLPAGEYELKVPGLPDQLLTVRSDGIAGGKLMKGSDGSMKIFDRWGNSVITFKVVADGETQSSEGKTAENPVGFGTGNTPGTGPMGGSMGLGMSPPGGPGPGGPMSGPGGPMSPGSPGRH